MPARADSDQQIKRGFDSSMMELLLPGGRE
jgi:hypothetical protein